MSTKTRELIKKIRACKTAEEERSCINKESAEMRNMHREASNQDKSRNLMKCIYMHMMGYSTTFIHVITVNLLASSNFTEKRVAYMSLCILLDERSEVLLLCTQTIKKDLENANFAIIAMALNAIGEVCTADMCRELSSEVGKLMYNANSYLKKKAACACSKIIRKCPELIETFLPNLKSYFEDKHHGVLLSGLSLVAQIFSQEPNCIQKFIKYQPVLTKHLKQLIAISYSPEFDVNGITDPFLQAKILQVLAHFGKGEQKSGEDLRDILSSVSNSTEGSKNTGNAILYELVRTINNINADTGLKSIASTVLGRFLTNRDSNYKYIALNTLREVVKTDIVSVQKHKNTILECLKDNDISIKRRALDLVYLIINSANIKQIINECISFLLTAEKEIKLELTTKIAQSLDKFSPSLKYQIDSLIKMLCISQNFVTEDTVANIINVIVSCACDNPNNNNNPNSNNSALILYSVHKCFLALKNNLSQEALVKVCVYVIGEFADVLVNNNVLGPDDEVICVTEADVVQVLNSVETNSDQEKYSSPVVLEYLMNCYLKLTTKFSSNVIVERIRSCLKEQTKSYFCEVQQRAVEYVTFGNVINESLRKEVTNRIPKLNANVIFDDNDDRIINIDVDRKNAKEVFNEDYDEDNINEDKKLMIKFNSEGVTTAISSGSGIKNFDKNAIDNISSIITGNSTNKPPSSTGLNLLDIFGNDALNFNIDPNVNVNVNKDNNNNVGNLLIPDFTTDNIINSQIAFPMPMPIINITDNIINNNKSNNEDLISNLNLLNLNPTTTSTTNAINFISTTSTTSNTNFIDLGVGVGASSNNNTNNTLKEVFKNSDITIHSDYSKSSLSDNTFSGSFYVSNNTDKPINNVNLKFMVLKHVNLKVLSTSGTYLEQKKNLGIKKEFTMNSNDQSKKIVMKIKISYTNEQNVEVCDTITLEDFN